VRLKEAPGSPWVQNYRNSKTVNNRMVVTVVRGAGLLLLGVVCSALVVVRGPWWWRGRPWLVPVGFNTNRRHRLKLAF